VRAHKLGHRPVVLLHPPKTRSRSRCSTRRPRSGYDATRVQSGPATGRRRPRSRGPDPSPRERAPMARVPQAPWTRSASPRCCANSPPNRRGAPFRSALEARSRRKAAQLSAVPRLRRTSRQSARSFDTAPFGRDRQLSTRRRLLGPTAPASATQMPAFVPFPKRANARPSRQQPAPTSIPPFIEANTEPCDPATASRSLP
jgi:hypothetical protein